MMMKQSWVGVGLRAPHIESVCTDTPPVGWFEVHSENYFHVGTPACQRLISIRDQYPVSLHGIGLSLGSNNCLDYTHLGRLKNLIEIIQPCFVSEHLSWNRTQSVFLPDLFPVPYNKESFSVFSDNINRVQDYLQIPLCIENPSSYLEYHTSTEMEPTFLVKLAQSTGAGILLDVNNVYVSCMNHGWDPHEYLNAIPLNLVKEIHLAGHDKKTLASGKSILIDTHDRVVSEPVWSLYRETVQSLGPIPTLIEWDADLPDFKVLIEEHDKAANILNPVRKSQYA